MLAEKLANDIALAVTAKLNVKTAGTATVATREGIQALMKNNPELAKTLGVQPYWKTLMPAARNMAHGGLAGIGALGLGIAGLEAADAYGGQIPEELVGPVGPFQGPSVPRQASNDILPPIPYSPYADRAELSNTIVPPVTDLGADSTHILNVDSDPNSFQNTLRSTSYRDFPTPGKPTRNFTAPLI